MNWLASTALVCLLLVLTAQAHAAPQIERTEDAIQVDLGNGATLSFAIHDGWLLGLQSARFGDEALTSPRTVQRPLVAQEYLQPGIWPFMKLVSAEVVEDEVRLEVELFGGDSRELFMEEFIFTPDREAAMGEGMTPQLEQLKRKAEAAREMLDPLVAEHESVVSIRNDISRRRERLEAGPQMPFDIQRQENQIRRIEDRLQNQKRRLYPEHVETDQQRRALQDIEAFEAALRERAEALSSIHRDYYAFAHLRLPSQTSRIDALVERIERHGEALRPGGTLVWTVRPETRRIAGWQWHGWSGSYRVKLNDGHQVNNIRQVGTWEVGGEAPGLTAVNLRYRGLGEIEQTFERADDGEGVRRAWSTTEMIPGAAGAAPQVSPVVPPEGDQTLEDRGYALRHRVGAWISKLGRGSGVGFVDFQHRDGLTLISSFDRQAAHRAVTEIFPGDRELSQTDEQWFANTAAFSTEPQLYLALKHEPGRHEMVTRWQEVDQYFRDVVSQDLGFVQVEPLPGVGWLVEGGRAGFYTGLADNRFTQWHDHGMRMHVTHTPGWYTEQHRDGPDRPQTPWGNSNRIFDWIITEDVKDSWRRLQDMSRQWDAPYFIYLGGMVRPDGPFAERIGPEPENWGMNAPDAGHSHGYPPLAAHNLYVPETRQLLTRRLTDIQEHLGFQGLWCDSFQNMFMSQLNWGDGSGAPMQAKWWPLLAEWSQRGIHLMSESHAFPGLSCSIEVSNWENAHHYFQYVWKWHRGWSQRRYSAEQHNEMTYRFMANKSWLAPDNATTDVIPDFPRLSGEYMAALPHMRRSWVLPEQRGVLWLPFDSDQEGVLFSYRQQDLPEGITARYILDEEAEDTTRLAERRTYRVRSAGADLPAALGMLRPEGRDERFGREYQPVEFRYPDPAED